MTLSPQEARSLILHCQGLAQEPREAPSLAQTFDRLGYVQIDTISVVERAHHHTLWTRIPTYQPAQLEAAVRSKSILEYWSHAAAYLPMSAYRFTLPRKKRLEKEGHWHRRDRKVMAQVMDRIRAEGPLRSADFEGPDHVRSGPWFEWKPAKKALEQLFMEGKLMVTGRQGFQKIYDLTERALPSDVDTRFPTDAERSRYLIETTLKSQGLATIREMTYLRRGILTQVGAELKKGVTNGWLKEVAVEGIATKKADEKYYALSGTLAEWLKSPPTPSHTQILSPFDSLVIQRKRLKTFFGMDYQIECYVPEPKRKFGYFCLPVLQGDRMIARIDAKADREKKELILKSFHWEKGLKKGTDHPALKKAIQRFADFNGCTKVTGRKP